MVFKIFQRIKIEKELVFFLLCFLIFSHSFSVAKEVKRILLKEVLSIGSVEDDLLYQLADVTTDPEGNIYVSDSLDFSIKKFSKNGKFLKKAGKKGQGPGEFFTPPKLIRYYQGLIYAAEQGVPDLKVISVFDRELNYKGRLPIKNPVSDFKILDEDSIAIGTLPLFEKFFHIFIYDMKGNLKRKIEYFKSDDIRRNMLGAINFETDEEGNFYIVYTFQDKIEKLDKNGKKLWSVSLFPGKKVKWKKPERVPSPFELPEDIVYKDIEIDKKGNIFVLVGSFSKNRSRDVYVFDKNGKYLTEFTLSEPTHLIYIDQENNIFSRANMGVTLKKYSLIYK